MFWQRDREHLFERVHRKEAHVLLHLRRQLREIGFVPRREDEFPDAVAPRRKRLLPDPADRQHEAAEGDLTGHRNVLADRLIPEGRHDRGGDRDAGGRPVLGNRPGGHVDVQIVFVEELGRDAQLRGLGADKADGRARRLLHHIPELTGEDQIVVPRRQQAGFDEEHVAAGFGPRHARRHARPRDPERDFLVEARRPEIIGHVRGLDAHLFAASIPGDYPRRDLSGDGADLPLQAPNAGFARVVAHDPSNCRVVELDAAGGQAMLFELPRNEIAPRDVELLLFAVACKRDDLHAIDERGMYGAELIGGGDEEHARQIDVDFEVVIAKRVVLGRIEHLEERGGRIALKPRGDFVDFVEHEHGIHRPGLLQRLHDPPGHRADVRPAMSADLRLVTDAAERNADELPVHCPRDRLPKRRLADARRADETQNRPLDPRARALLPLQLLHRQVLDDALFDLIEIVVILVEHRAGGDRIESVVGRNRPRHIEHPIDVGADHLVFG